MRSFSGHTGIKYFELHHMWDVKYALPLVFSAPLECKGEVDHFLSPSCHCREVEQHSDTDHIEAAIDMHDPVDEPVVGH